MQAGLAEGHARSGGHLNARRCEPASSPAATRARVGGELRAPAVNGNGNGNNNHNNNNNNNSHQGHVRVLPEEEAVDTAGGMIWGWS